MISVEMTNLQDTITLAVKQGLLRGRVNKLSENLDGRRYFSFQGVPYAHPPLGNLRFQAPIEAKPWKGVRDAFAEGPSSVQNVVLLEDKKIFGEEDCLYLNIYVPEQDDLKMFQTLPVMVYIHGGGFFEGSGDANLYGPDLFMRNGNVILVTINYRLGPLGFLYLGTDKIPGNAGLKDQLFALRWIQDNILRFRGDPDNVTIFGESAGGASVHYLLLTPQSKGLFHRGIMQSGSVINTWAYTEKNQSKLETIKFAKDLGCESDNLDAVADFLMHVPAYTLAGYIKKHHILKVPYTPVNDTSSKDSLFSAEPTELMKSGNFNKVPIMIGACAQEGILFNIHFARDENLLSNIANDFSLLIPGDLFKNVEINTDKKAAIINKIKKFYFDDQPISTKNYSKIIDIESDLAFLVGIKLVVDNFVEVASECPVYLYRFDYEGELGFFKKLISSEKCPTVEGPTHVDDLGYLFRVNKYLSEPVKGSTEFSVMERMIDIWTNFAISGNPSRNLYVNWEPYNRTRSFLSINSSLGLEDDFFNERIQFWKRISKELGIFLS